ncbi:class I tRNA ligase family protein, partial [Altererythrobacter sp.]|uniref:class I tRNA ligase family protein n=1 Tax=Altererythrobacter sp. TaxID=1872480 RepID=UPI003D14B83C
GQDQKQHVEMARDIAQRFNHHYGEIFVLPEAVIGEDTAVLKGLDGRKMSKSLGNNVTPQEVIDQSGADILRLWVASSDFTEDLRIGPEIIKTKVDAYRKLRNTIRWMLGSLAHYRVEDAIAEPEMPELERLMLSELARLDALVRGSYDAFDFKRVFAALFNFMTVDLSAFYFDIRKDALYCDPISSVTRRAALTVIDRLFDGLVKWLAPCLPF